MTDYNDGKWHGWNGGKCPVHPESEVQCRLFHISSPDDGAQDLAKEWFWDATGRPSSVIAFRVTKPYVEPPKPREMWLFRGHAFTSKERAEKFRQDLVAEYGNEFLAPEWEPTLYREVLK